MNGGDEMKVKKPWNYDDAYDKDIAEWEDFLRYSRLSDKRMTWYINLPGPFILMGIGFAGWSWVAWIGILGLYLVFVQVFSFFEEVNENIRYTRHKVVKGLENEERNYSSLSEE
jgi:hypothetical protein